MIVEFIYIYKTMGNGYTFKGGNCENCFASLLKSGLLLKEFALSGHKFFSCRIEPFF